MNYKTIILCVSMLLTGLLIGEQIKTKNIYFDQDTDRAKTYAMNVVVSGVPFWADAKETWSKINDVVPNIKTVYGGPLNTDANRQIEEIELLISQKVEGIVIAPCDSKALVPVINKAVDAGIPVVTAFADAPESKRLCYIGLSQKDCGRQVAQSILHNFPQLKNPKTRVVISLAGIGIEDQQQRAEGFMEVIKENHLQLVQLVEDQYDESKGADALSAILARDSDVKIIFGCDSRSAIGAVTALRQSGRTPGSVLVTGWDNDHDVLMMIKEGWVYATAAQYSSLMTQLSFSVLESYNGKYLYPKSLRLEENGIRPMPECIYIPISLVTSKNVDAYFRKN